jgi:hypothetical protein
MPLLVLYIMLMDVLYAFTPSKMFNPVIDLGSTPMVTVIDVLGTGIKNLLA